MRGLEAKRILSFLLAFVLLWSTLPLTVMAEEGQPTPPPPNHKHNEAGWSCRSEKVLTCADPDHQHDAGCYQDQWTCEKLAEFVTLKVEYFVQADGQDVRVEETHDAVLKSGTEYFVKLPDLSEKGYALDTDHIYLVAEDGSKTPVELQPDADGFYFVGGVIDADKHYIVNYKYVWEEAPYRVNYYGSDTTGSNQALLYAFIGKGIKDQRCTPAINANEMMKTVYDTLSAAAVTSAGDSGDAMIAALVQAVDAAYPDQSHDITPFLQGIAQKKGVAVSALTRAQIKQYIADNMVKMYGLDTGRNTESDVGFVITSDELAEKNIYYTTGKQFSVLFTTGVADTMVVGIPQQDFPATPDADGVTVKYAVSYDTNRISTLPTVDISRYTAGIDGKGIYAQPDPNKGQTHRFIGWVTSPNSGVITDYTPDAAAAGGRYANLTIYSTPELIADLSAKGYKPAGGSFVNLADALKTMPDSNRTYYAVWEPFMTDYVVQIWFEDPDTENLYNIDHSLDIVRTAPINSVVSHNSFDVERADETKVVSAANNKGGSFPVKFTDPDSRYGVEDVYTSYQNSYVYSPFYGFDFYVCEECKNNPGGCTCAQGNCTCESCKKMTLGVDPVTGQQTTGNRCNCGSITLDNSGKNVLNVFYTREMWQIVYHPTVELTAYKDYSTTGGTVLEGGTLVNALETIVGRFTDDLTADMMFESIGKPQFPYPWDKQLIFTYQGKYGMPISQGHEIFEDGTVSTTPMGAGYTGTDFSQWKEIVRNYYDGYPYQSYDLYLPRVGEYTNNYREQFLKETTLAASDLYVSTEPHNYDYYLNRNLKLESAKLPFAGVAEITPAVYLEYENKGNDCDDMVLGTPENVIMQRYTGTWKGNRFTQESSYFLDRNDNRHTGSHYEYGTHTMQLYPFYGNVANVYNIDYYVEALPSEPDANCLTDTRTNTRYTLLKTDTVDAPCDVLQYQAKIPEGFTAQMWRTSIAADFTKTNAAFTGTKVTNVITQSGTRKPYSIPPNKAMANPSLSNYANYQRNQIFDGASYYAYLPTFEVWQGSSKMGNIVPDGYWITDWIRLTTDSTANMTTNVTSEMKERLKSSVMIGALYPTNSDNRWRYMNTRPNAMNGFLYPRSETTTDFTQMNAKNAIALTRDKYTITYNTALVDANGKLLTDEKGEVRVMPIYTTENILYQQMLDGTGNANNYYNGYFCYDPSASSPFTLIGYKNGMLPGDASADATAIGGMGNWYLDADGTIPFNASAMATMPAKNIDVYFQLKDIRYNVVFIDRKTGKQTLTLTMNGQQETFRNVLANQVVRGNGTATPIPDPVADGFSFAGWYLDEAGTIPFSFDQEITADTVVYAAWKPKTPTTYTILHILEKPDGTREELKGTVKNQPGYVGDTVDAEALHGIYDNGTYFEPDYYSQTMVLERDSKNNVFTFVYHSTERRYRIEFREKKNPAHEVATSVVVSPTDLDYITAKYQNLEDWGWELSVGEDEYKSLPLVDRKDNVIVFYYDRMPGPTLNVRGIKFLDEQPSEGTRFTFILTGPEGYEQRVQAVNGVITFEEVYFNKVGDYTFTLVEEDEGGLMKYDESVYEISLSIAADEKSVLYVSQEPTITLNGEPYTEPDVVFSNQTIILPPTGDRFPLIPLAFASMLSAAAIVLLLMMRRKKEQE